MREKIARNEFVESGKILHESESVKLNETEDVEAGVSADSGSQATPWDPKTRIELMQNLLLFGCYYLQKYPEKTISFLDYLLFLIHWSQRLNVPGLVQLDREMRRHFSYNPDWHWAQDHSACQLLLIAVSLKDEYKLKKWEPGADRSRNNFTPAPPASARPQVPPQSQYSGRGKSAGFSNRNPRNCGGRGGGRHDTARAPVQKINEICDNFNTKGCTYPGCRRRHVCYCGSDKHSARDCPNPRMITHF